MGSSLTFSVIGCYSTCWALEGWVAAILVNKLRLRAWVSSTLLRPQEKHENGTEADICVR